MDSPLNRVMDLIHGYRTTQTMSVAIRLGIADHLASGPKTAAEMAPLVSVNPTTLHQLLRYAASHGVFAEDNAGRFVNTPMSECLRRGAPGAVDTTEMMVRHLLYPGFGELMHAVRTGEPAFAKVFGQPLFEHLSANEDLGRKFDAHMTNLYQPQVEALLDVFDFSTVGRILDVGGGRGTVIRTLLARYPDFTGGLFDLPAVVARTRDSFEKAGLLDRCAVESGSFFESLPGGYDAYLLKHVLHDWNDDKCGLILANIRRAIDKYGRLLVLEYIVPTGNDRSVAKDFDMNMLALLAGRERTERDFRDLLGNAGFRLDRVVPSATPLTVLQASPV